MCMGVGRTVEIVSKQKSVISFCLDIILCPYELLEDLMEFVVLVLHSSSGGHSLILRQFDYSQKKI